MTKWLGMTKWWKTQMTTLMTRELISSFLWLWPVLPSFKTAACSPIHRRAPTWTYVVSVSIFSEYEQAHLIQQLVSFSVHLWQLSECFVAHKANLMSILKVKWTSMLVLQATSVWKNTEPGYISEKRERESKLGTQKLYFTRIVV